MKTLRKGFTLVEMLIVIVIIGILAAALIPRLTGAQAQARDTARLADLNQLGTSLAVFNADNSAYPNPNLLASNAGTSLSGLVTAGYLKSVPTDPQTSNQVTVNTFTGGLGQYVYQTIAAGSNFVLAANTEVTKKGNMLYSSGALASVMSTGSSLATVQSNIVASSNFTNQNTIFVYAN